MRFAAILVAISTLAAPVYAQTADNQDHSAHHPAGEGPTAPGSTGVVSEAPGVPGAAGRSESSGPMSCAMMPEMMQSMMRGMMQGMRSTGAGEMGSGMGQSSGTDAGMGSGMRPGMGAGMSTGMGTGMKSVMGSGMGMGSGMRPGMGGAAGAGQMQPADQSLPAITYRAIARRTVSSIMAAPGKGDAEFLRLVAVLEEALADAARVAAAFSESPEVRQKAQQLATTHMDDLLALRALLDAKK